MQRTGEIGELLEKFEEELIRVKYSKARLSNFRTIVKRLREYAKANGVEKYNIDLGQEFLCKKYPIEYGEKPIANLRSSTQYAIRTIYMINDFYLHGVFTRVNRLKGCQGITKETDEITKEFEKYNRDKGHSEQSVYRFSSEIKSFLRYLHNNEIKISEITERDVIDFFGIYIDRSRDTVKKMLMVMRKFLSFLNESGNHESNLSTCVPSGVNIQNDKIPSVWETDDVRTLLSSVDRGNALGKRDYAILMLVTTCGLRVSDVRELKLSDIDWDKMRIEIFQSKTGKPVCLPLLEEVGWAIIDYLKYGRPNSDIPNVFLTHVPPIMGFSCTSSLSGIIKKYARAVGIRLDKNQKHGLHSLRHSLASRLLEMNTPLPIISEVLGHASPNEVDVYLKVDVESLRQCSLNPEEVFESVSSSKYS